VWDAALHLAHFLHQCPVPPQPPVLELGSGMGVLGLAVERMLLVESGGRRGSSRGRGGESGQSGCGVLQAQLLDPLQRAGFTVTRVYK